MLLIPPQAPASLRGREVVLRLSVDERGRVREVEIVTALGNSRYEQQLRRTAMDWQFNPARDPENRAVAAKVDITIDI